MRTLLLLLVCSCGDNVAPDVRLLEDPDAGVDAAPADACTHTVDASADDCCRFLPDTSAVITCSAPGPGSCGVIACELADCTFQKINFCTAGS